MYTSVPGQTSGKPPDASREDGRAIHDMPDPRRRERRRRFVLGTITVATVLIVYTVISTRPGNNPALIPPPDDVIGALWTNLENGNLPAAIGASLQRIAMGYAIGTTSAVVIGSIMGWFRTFEYIVDPIIEALRPIPPLAYIPLVLIWFGIGEVSRVFVLSLACFVTCIINVIAGMKEVPKVYVDAASTLGASRLQVFLSIAIPSALPFIFTGLRIALAAAWTALVAAELLAAQSGLGFMLQQGRRFFLTDQVVFVIAIIGLLAFSMDRLFRVVQNRLTAWSETNR